MSYLFCVGESRCPLVVILASSKCFVRRGQGREWVVLTAHVSCTSQLGASSPQTTSRCILLLSLTFPLRVASCGQGKVWVVVSAHHGYHSNFDWPSLHVSLCVGNGVLSISQLECGSQTEVYMRFRRGTGIPNALHCVWVEGTTRISFPTLFTKASEVQRLSRGHYVNPYILRCVGNRWVWVVGTAPFERV